MIPRDALTTSRSRRRRTCVAAALWACGGGLVLAGLGPDLLGGDELPVSVGVKSLAAPAASTEPEAQPMATQTAVTQPTLPGGKLPQYHLGSGQSVEDVATLRDDPGLRLLLMLSAEPILLEAQITVDGKPFRSVREQRIQRILAAIAADEQPTPPEISGSGDSGSEDIPADTSLAPEVIDAEKSADETQEQDAASQPAVAAYVPAGSAQETIRRYVRASSEEASPEEIRWLLTNWIDGPVLLMLNPNFQRFRAEERPVFDLLDRDHDGTLSAAELERAALSFQECDRNGDDIVDALEISRAAAKFRDEASPSREDGRRRGWLVLPVPVSEFSSAREQRFIALAGVQEPGADGGGPLSSALRRFDADADGQLKAEDLQALHEAEPDVRLTIAFNTAEPSDARLAVTAVHEDLGGGEAVMSTASATVTLSLHGVPVEFSAVQVGESDQVSVGAVVDGYPLLALLDPNDDGRFTIRELRELVDRLRSLDRDDDGRLTADEVQTPVRVCIGLGPLVHRELAGIRSIDRPQTTDPVTGPDWFARMDRNRDLDLTRSEFPGSDEQFLQLDADGDGLISAQEALDFDQQSDPPPAEPQEQTDEPS